MLGDRMKRRLERPFDQAEEAADREDPFPVGIQRLPSNRRKCQERRERS